MKFEKADKYDRAPAMALVAKHQACTFPRTVKFAGLDLAVDAGVFCPDLTKTSQLTLECLERSPIDRTWVALDVFTGCGAFAVYAASKGCRAVAVDISPVAVACAQRNAARNGVSHLVEVRQGDVLAPLKDAEKFDLVIASPPLLPGVPETSLEAALVDPGLSATLRLIERLPAHLSRGGRALLFLSDVFARVGNDIFGMCAAHRLSANVAISKDVGYEVYSVIEMRHA